MRLELKRKTPVGGAVPGELFLNGEFFGYTLENEKSIFPVGVYDLYYRVSPKFGRAKVHVQIPGREYIMFHGANTSADLAGCIGVAYTAPAENVILGDLSDELEDLFEDSGKTGVLVVTDEKGLTASGVLARLWPLFGLGLFAYYLLKNKP